MTDENSSVSVQPPAPVPAIPQPVLPPANGLPVGEVTPIPPTASGSGFDLTQIPPPQKNSRLRFIGLIVLVFVLVAAAAGAYWFYYQAPDKVMQRMGKKLAQVKTVDYEGDLQYEMREKNTESTPLLGMGGLAGQSLTIDFSVKGATDWTDPSQVKSKMKVSVAGSVMHVGGNLSADVISIGKMVYFKTGKLPEFMGSSASQIENKWISWNVEEIQKQLQSGMSGLAGDDDSAKTSKDLTPQNIEQIKNLAVQNKIIGNIKKLPAEKIGGINCFHYQLVIDKSALANFIVGAAKVFNGDTFTASDYDDMRTSMAQTGITNPEIWIGKSDNLPYKLKLALTSNDKTSSYVSTIKFIYTANKYNAPTDISAPAESTPVEDIMKSIEGSSGYGDSRSKARDARRQSDMRQLVSAQEMYYGYSDKYLTSAAYPAAIGTFLNPTPNDPGGGTAVSCSQADPAFVYCTIDNTHDPQKFCYYTRLESGEYFTSSHAGNFRRNTKPTTLDECAEVENSTIGDDYAPIINQPVTDAKSRDARRMSDMRQMISAQEMYYGDNDRYLTSPLLPTTIGNYLNPVPKDPGGGSIVYCAQDKPAFIYCALDNTADAQKFCYYAKLESGGYYTASHAGNFKRATRPKSLADCATTDIPAK